MQVLVAILLQINVPSLCIPRETSKKDEKGNNLRIQRKKDLCNKERWF